MADTYTGPLPPAPSSGGDGGAPAPADGGGGASSYTGPIQNDPGSSYGQAFGVGAMESVPYGRQLTALGARGLDLYPSYEEANKALMGASERAHRDYPKTTTGTALGLGALETAALPVSEVATAARIAPMVARLGTGTLLGTGYGASRGEGWFDPYGAAIGAGLGLAGGALGEGAGAVANAARRVAGWYNPATEAARQISAKSAATGKPLSQLTPEDFPQPHLAETPSHGGHGAAGFILGPVARQLSPTAGGALSGAYLGYEATPHEASWGETARNMGLGALGIGAATNLALRGGGAQQATEREIANQLTNWPAYGEALKSAQKWQGRLYDPLRQAGLGVLNQLGGSWAPGVVEGQYPSWNQ